MGTDDSGSGGEPLRVRPTWATPEASRSQVLVRQTCARRGWFRPARYEVAYYPEGLTTSPWWVRETTALTAIPGMTHTTDLHDLRVLLEEAWAEGDQRWTAWPVWYPAVAGDVDGLVHELTSTDRTRCGLVQPGLTRLGTAFHAADPRACPTCSSSSRG